MARDQEQLKRFRCSDHSPAQDDVEDFFRRTALAWSFERDHFLYVAVEDLPADEREEDDADHRERIVGCVAYEPGDENEWFIKAIAVALSRQRQGVGADLLSSILAHLEALTPGWAALWNVDVDNYPSHRMSESVGGEGLRPPGYNELVLFWVRLSSAEPGEG